MSRSRRNGGYLGGSTVLQQRRNDFEAMLSQDAKRTRKRAARDQAEFDQQQQMQRQAVLDKIAKADAETRRPWHRCPTPGTKK